jgi:predicted MPP superfamily phosphohydrolase
MIFILALVLMFSTQGVFTYTFFHQNGIFFQAIGFGQLAIYVLSFLFLLKYFSQRPKNDYKPGFTAFGFWVAFGVPTLIFFVPGIIYLWTNQMFWFQFGGWMSLFLFVGIVYGIFVGRWRWKVHREVLAFKNLPKELDGLTFVQLSDMHIGSFFGRTDKVARAIQQINALQADYFFFTGDLVNNSAEELNGWVETLSAIQVKKEKFSILGNHDYGDYVGWENDLQKSQNLQNLISAHQQIGWKPLLNDRVKMAEGFWLLGVENWGKAPFRQSGRLNETLEGIPERDFKILLSHDPSHFDEQVKMTSVDLTLSGHTHGMQFGIERFGIKWSPVSLRYKKWAGLYSENGRYLYVNRGFGYLGFPGRVGIYPEITHFTLRSDN